MLPINFNAELFGKAKTASTRELPLNFIYKIDTLELPFVDDFSTNKQKYFETDTALATDTVVTFRYTYNDSVFDTIVVAAFGDTTYTYTWDETNQTLDSVPNDSIEIVKYNQYIYPSNIVDTLVYYPNYTIYDTVGDASSDTIYNTGIETIEVIQEFNTFYFFEDDNSLWMDEEANVFINNRYAILPPTIGVATFDAIDEFGAIYPHANTTQFLSDVLSSKPINLEDYDKDDSLYFSFFLQPEGYGNAPDEQDSLVLEFRTDSSDWEIVWSSPGLDLQELQLPGDTTFLYISFPITDSIYFRKSFKFRFKNFASLATEYSGSWASDADHWNIDYVILSDRRGVDGEMEEILYNDIAFSKDATSLLSRYQAVPYNHYRPELMKTDLVLWQINHFSKVKQMSYNYKIFDAQGSEVGNGYDGGNFNIVPFRESGFHFYQPHIYPKVEDEYPLLTEPTFFTVEHAINATPDTIRSNDTIRFKQIFEDYYAYDDGTAEAGYGINTGGAKFAYRFAFPDGLKDTLIGIQMYFNQVYKSVNKQIFTLKVWDGKLVNGSDDSDHLIFEKEFILPEYSDSLNKFITYSLDTIIEVEDSIYIGWQQSSEEMLNVGFDRNNIANTYMYYNTKGDWKKSSLPGAVMMRPLFGDVVLENIKKHKIQLAEFKVFPNPTTGLVTLTDLPNNQNTIHIFNQLGELIHNETISNETYQIDLSDYSKGMYFLNVSNENNIQSKPVKVIVQ